VKTVASLRGRLEQRAAEIQQLEDLLQQADARASGRVQSEWRVQGKFNISL